MSIRARLTIWYSLFLLLGFGLIAGWAYYEMAVAHPTVFEALRASGHTPMEELGEVLAFGGLPALLLAWIGGFFLMRHALAPVTRLTEAIERIHAENLRQQLPAQADGELMMQSSRICVPLNGARKPDEAPLDLTAIEKEDAQLQSATGLIAVVKQLAHQIQTGD